MTSVTESIMYDWSIQLGEEDIAATKEKVLEWDEQVKTSQSQMRRPPSAVSGQRDYRQTCG